MSGPNRHHRIHRYRPWRGGPDPLAPPFDVREALDAIGEDVLAGGSLRDALRDLLRRGLPGEQGQPDRPGLDELRAKAARMRREAARRGRLDGAVTRAQARLDQALASEREELAGRDDDTARFAEARLDNLPRSAARAVSDLQDYRWASKDAERIYREILDDLRGDVLDQRFRGLRDALSGMRPGAGDAQRQEADQAVKDMLSDLNGLLARHARGEDTTEAFEQFMARHGDMFPEDPKDVDELVDVLARRAAAAQRLMASLTPQQREELRGLMAAALGDPDLAAQLAALDDTLRVLRPDLSWERGERMRGDDPLGYGEAADALAELADLDDLMDSLGQQHPGATLDDVDVEQVERVLGSGAAQDVRRLQQLERELERQGWLVRGDDGLELSPKSLRRLGQTALRQVFEHLAEGGRGEHDVRDAGASGEATGASRPWEFGDEQPLDVVRTVANAVRRGVPVPSERVVAPGHGRLGRPQRRIELHVEDFEVVETERRSSAAVALCVDLSYSMISEGRWGPMKQTALALAHLVATRFPQDALQIIGFGRHASALSVEQLAGVEPDFVQGTNLQHALRIAGRHLRRHPDGEPVVLVVTDGEPTAHLAPDGHATFAYPPLPETIQATVAEVDALTRYGAAINVFMLGEDPGLQRFVDAIARRNGGRVFTPALDRLGQYVVSDYLRTRRGRRG
ncbi:MAG: vWA domain-containing protein [Kineosporiaceae bacterium]